ncbi:MAG: sulfite exporter TauE/SafE family protein [Pseudomonadota bacterium]
MPEALATALGTPGLVWVCLASLSAGLVYGFAGFGSALIFMPLATIFLPPAVAVGAFSLSALASLFTVVPGAWRSADKPTVGLMIGMCILLTPVGVLALRFAPAEALRVAISILTLVTLAALIAGWKVPLRGGWRLRAGIGGLAGLTGGSTGLNGPPVILFNLGSDQPVEVTRGNLACFLTLSSLTFLPQLWLQGLMPVSTLWIGIILFVPYAIGTALGARVFNPDWAGFYRRFAYGLIGCAGLAGLPIWGG